ncbi:membrane protein DedA, SNARE-associated domain [Streptomyces sp. DvalAA-14]|uniref:DedA family protein n=1 Tax=unclassified Streptomyces TaxID=2593676 RepID=UPI00081B3DBF|nr:VTT domain-containing protein [Streptomyces sp. DvalAA-14]SCE03760.1 membrane protein DedA, SNARE-associated domain [Streptomyces sp. DvalAA-14]
MIGLLASAAAHQPASDSTRQAIGYPTLFLLVVLGSLVPVVPTGALVSGAAVVAFHDTEPVSLAVVFAVASVAAFLGDVALYWLGLRGAHSRGGSRWLHRLQDRVDAGTLERAERRLDRHGSAVLVLSRLIPAGRIPVMVACLLAEMPLRRFVRGDIAACLAWAAAYQVIGILGGSLFPEPWQGVALAVGLTFAIAAGPAVVRRLRRGRKGPVGPAEAEAHAPSQT